MLRQKPITKNYIEQLKKNILDLKWKKKRMLILNQRSIIMIMVEVFMYHYRVMRLQIKF